MAISLNGFGELAVGAVWIKKLPFANMRSPIGRGPDPKRRGILGDNHGRCRRRLLDLAIARDQKKQREKDEEWKNENRFHLKKCGVTVLLIY